MFVTFAAALVGMLYYTGRVQSVEEFMALVEGKQDSTASAEAYLDPEDKLGQIFELAEEYKRRLEEETKNNEAFKDSLMRQEAQILARKDSLFQERKQLGLEADSLTSQREEASVKELAKFYSKMKPAAAAEILQQDEILQDTTVARIMKKLPPEQMGKIMAAMESDFAAGITKLMKEVD